MRDEGLWFRDFFKHSPLPRPSAKSKRPMRVYYITFVLSILLIIGGFFCPPIGVIDGSVLTAVGLLLMFGVLSQIPRILDAIRNGTSVKISKGDFTAEIDATDND